MILVPLLMFQLWDINMDSGPVATFQVHEHIRPKVMLFYGSLALYWWFRV